MNRYFLFLVSSYLCFSVLSAQAEELSPAVKDELRKAQISMLDCFSAGDIDCFLRMTTKDYRTVNAYGAYLTRDEMAPLLPSFKGSTYKILEQHDRYYGNVAISTGRIQFFIKFFLVADVHFTQIWVYQDGKWMYDGWQGTLTGLSKNYPVYALLALLAVILLVLATVRWLRRRKVVLGSDSGTKVSS